MDNTDQNNKPSNDGLEDHQVWVWVMTPTEPHWEIRGTGLIASAEIPPDDPDVPTWESEGGR